MIRKMEMGLRQMSIDEMARATSRQQITASSGVGHTMLPQIP